MDDVIPKIVVARNDEDVSWAEGYDVDIVQKGVDLPNLGREPSSYVYYIINNYECLSGDYVFLQGNPLDHCKNLDEQIKKRGSSFEWFKTDRSGLRCDMMGHPHDHVDIKEFLDKIGIKYDKDYVVFNGCCLFKVSADRIRERSLEFYSNLFEVLMTDPKAPYAFERTVGLIFGD